VVAIPTLATYTADGIEVRVHGARSSHAPLLEVHGLVSSIHHWTFFTPHFASERPVISWDYRGHGGQAPPHEPVDIALFANDAHAVWRAASPGPSVVVGLSFGVQVALEIWRRHPEMVRALVLICGTAGHPLDRVSASPILRRATTRAVRELGRHPRMAAALLGFLATERGRWLAREIAYATGGARRDACPPEVLEGLFRHVAELAPELIADVTVSYLEHSAFDVLPTITVPTLIIAGDKDQLTPVATAERMHHAIPDSELVVFTGHSHLVQVEKPREVHAAIAEFLAKHRL
jgi:pimeloyl-ACP methyl ester carboxylesterase